MTTAIRSMETGEDLAYELRIEAPAELVWRYWTEPDRLVRWMGKVATVEPEPGGIFRVDYGQGDVVSGEFLEVAAGRRAAFTWGWETPDGRTDAGRVEIELEPIDDAAATLLRVRHAGLDAESRKSHDEGWRHFLPQLAEAVAQK
ncbi:MAG: SRPBCC domain-containing protein [Chloroflexota bacterium]